MNPQRPTELKYSLTQNYYQSQSETLKLKVRESDSSLQRRQGKDEDRFVGTIEIGRSELLAALRTAVEGLTHIPSSHMRLSTTSNGTYRDTRVRLLSATLLVAI